MSKYHFLGIGLLALAVGGVGVASAQQTPAAGVPSRILVTVEPKHGSSVPTINREDVRVYEGHDRDTVTDWVPAQGDRAALELFILIDDESNTTLGTQLEDIRQFITAQPPRPRSAWHTCRMASREWSRI